LPPNTGRLLHRWGVYKLLQKWAVSPQAINIRRWENGKIIGYTDLGDTFRTDFGVSYNVVHRAHLHEAMHERAKELGVDIQLDKRVVQYQEEAGSVTLADGSVVQSDLVVAADGKL
jgi:salicylate hydroxylase